MVHHLVHYQPCDAAAEAGHVVLDSENGVAVTMTAEAAERTAQRLVSAAQRAHEQAQGNRPPIE